MSLTRALLWVIIAALLVLLGWSIFQFINRRQQVIEPNPAPALVVVPSASASPVVVSPRPTAPVIASTPRATATPVVVAQGDLPKTGPEVAVYGVLLVVLLGIAGALVRSQQIAAVKRAYRQ